MGISVVMALEMHNSLRMEKTLLGESLTWQWAIGAVKEECLLLAALRSNVFANVVYNTSGVNTADTRVAAHTQRLCTFGADFQSAFEHALTAEELAFSYIPTYN